jgi:hypothetical protein
MLVTALALAVVLVVLVLLVNTAIYTENLATRDADVGADDALEHRAAVVDGVGGVLDRENRAEYDSRAALETSVRGGVGALDSALAAAALDRGVSARTNGSAATMVDGRLLRQTDDDREFTNATGTDADWAVASDLNGTRRFDARVDRSSLAAGDESDVSDAFRVRVTGNTTGTEWRAYVYRDSGDVAVAVKNDTDPVTEVCSANAAEATVSFTDGRLAGEPCPGLTWAGGVSDRYDVRYGNAENVTGTYNLTVRTADDGVVRTGQFNDGTAVADPDSPYHVPAVYAVRLPVASDAPELTHGSTVRVAPGERDD